MSNGPCLSCSLTCLLWDADQRGVTALCLPVDLLPFHFLPFLLSCQNQKEWALYPLFLLTSLYIIYSVSQWIDSTCSLPWSHGSWWSGGWEGVEISLLKKEVSGLEGIYHNGWNIILLWNQKTKIGGYTTVCRRLVWNLKHIHIHIHACTHSKVL